MSWHALSCHVTSCHDMSFHVRTGHVMSCHVMSWLVMSWHVTSCHVMPWHALSCQVTSCHVMSFHAMSGHVMSCHVMSCHVMSCHGMSSDGIEIFGNRFEVNNGREVGLFSPGPPREDPCSTRPYLNVGTGPSGEALRAPVVWPFYEACGLMPHCTRARGTILNIYIYVYIYMPMFTYLCEHIWISKCMIPWPCWCGDTLDLVYWIPSRRLESQCTQCVRVDL